MTTFYVYANGIFWDLCEAGSADEAMQIVADRHGTIDVGQTHASTAGMEAWPNNQDPLT